MKKDVLNLKDVQSILVIGRSKALELFHSEDFPSFKIARKWLVRYDAFIEYLDKVKDGEVSGV